MTVRSNSPLSRIVVGADGSPSSAAALEWACSQAGVDDLIHVVHALNPTEELALAAIQIDWTSLRSQAQRQLEGEWTAQARTAAAQVQSHLVEDDPADALMVSARRFGASAIVVGAHGSGAKGYLLGSAINKLLRRCELPIIVVNEPGEENTGAIEPYVLACVGYGRSGTGAALWAADYASAQSHPLRLLHVVSHRPFFPKDSPMEVLQSHLGSDSAMAWAQDNLDRLAVKIRDRHPQLTTTTTIASGSAVNAIAAASSEACLVVLGHRSFGISLRLRRLLSIGAPVTAVVPTCQKH